jgi:hypothetical protein
MLTTHQILGVLLMIVSIVALIEAYDMLQKERNRENEFPAERSRDSNLE